MEVVIVLMAVLADSSYGGGSSISNDGGISSIRSSSNGSNVGNGNTISSTNNSNTVRQVGPVVKTLFFQTKCWELKSWPSKYVVPLCNSLHLPLFESRQLNNEHQRCGKHPLRGVCRDVKSSPGKKHLKKCNAF